MPTNKEKKGREKHAVLWPECLIDMVTCMALQTSMSSMATGRWRSRGKSIIRRRGEERTECTGLSEQFQIPKVPPVRSFPLGAFSLFAMHAFLCLFMPAELVGRSLGERGVLVLASGTHLIQSLLSPPAPTDDLVLAGFACWLAWRATCYAYRYTSLGYARSNEAWNRSRPAQGQIMRDR